MLKKKKILFVFYKATSELDFALPLIWKLKKNRESYDIKVLYAVLNKKMILRKSTLYSEIFRELGVKEYDYSNFLRIPASYIATLIRRMFSFSYWDISIARYYGRKQNIKLLVKKYFIKVLKIGLKVVERVILRAVSFDKLFKFFSPDILFFPLRDFTFYGKNKFYRYTFKEKPRVVLYPHSPFPSTGKYNVDYGGYASSKSVLPDFCSYWYSFEKELTPSINPGLDKQSYCVGFPGMDSDWLNYLKNRNDNADKAELTCMLVIRRFIESKPNDGTKDYFYVSEFKEMISHILNAFRYSNKKIKLVVKPHPQNDFLSVRAILNNVGFKDYKITYEPIYAEITNADFIIGVSSGILTIPAVLGIPVVLLDSTAKDLFEKWEITKDLFSNSQFFVPKYSDLPNVINSIVKYVINGDEVVEKKIQSEVSHFRKYFPDNSKREHLLPL